MNEKHKLALLEGFKKAGCVATNAAMFYFFPSWVWGDESWFPADPVWVHITITMLCELDTMDKLNEKIILRTAGTTIGAVSGYVMTWSGLTDWHRLAIIMVWMTILGFIEKLDPARSYTWTIATVTFGIANFLGRKGLYMTPWKRWWSIILGTIVTAIWLLLLPALGILPKRIIRDELGETARSAWSGSLSMLEDALQNAGNADACKRLTDKQNQVHGLLGKWPAIWKQYKYARTWCNLQPNKPLPMDNLQAFLKGPLLDLFLSSSAAARALHKGKNSGEADSRAEKRAKHDHVAPALLAELAKIKGSVTSVVTVIATKNAAEDVRIEGTKELAIATGALSTSIAQLQELPSVHQAALGEAFLDIVKAVTHLNISLGDVKGASSVSASCDKLRKELSAISS